MNKGNLLGALFLTDFHRWTEAFLRTSCVVVYSISHRFSQMNRSLSANRGNPQTSVSRRQISQNVIAVYHRTLQPSLAETLCVIGWSKALYNLTPGPSPNGEGSDHRGYPYFAACAVIGMWTHPDVSLANHQHLTPNIQHPSLAITFCDICMPEAFCEFETVR